MPRRGRVLGRAHSFSKPREPVLLHTGFHGSRDPQSSTNTGSARGRTQLLLFSHYLLLIQSFQSLSFLLSNLNKRGIFVLIMWQYWHPLYLRRDQTAAARVSLLLLVHVLPAQEEGICLHSQSDVNISAGRAVNSFCHLQHGEFSSAKQTETINSFHTGQ